MLESREVSPVLCVPKFAFIDSRAALKPNEGAGSVLPMPAAVKARLDAAQEHDDDSADRKGKTGSWARPSRGRPKKNRAPLRNVVKGPERVDGGMTVRS